jgi:hypothetical protein
MQLLEEGADSPLPGEKCNKLPFRNRPASKPFGTRGFEAKSRR